MPAEEFGIERLAQGHFGQWGIERPIFRLEDDPLYALTHRFVRE